MDITLLYMVIQIYITGTIILGFLNSPLSLARLSMRTKLLFLIPTLMVSVLLYTFYFEMQRTTVQFMDIPMTEGDFLAICGMVLLFAITVYTPNNFGLKTNHDEVIQKYYSANENTQLEER